MKPEIDDLPPEKEPTQCPVGYTKENCPNLKCTYEGPDGERYRCAKCGESFFLDYDDMK